MDILLSNAVLGGYLSNETPNCITGQLYLTGCKHPVRVELQGNFLRDIAGCRIDFTNAVPMAEIIQLVHLNALQTGVAGEMTASRRVRRTQKRHSPPADSFLQRTPDDLKNIMFLEWFNPHGQRILIQAWHWNIKVSAPAWSMESDYEKEMLKGIRAHRRAFLLSRRER